MERTTVLAVPAMRNGGVGCCSREGKDSPDSKFLLVRLELIPRASLVATTAEAASSYLGHSRIVEPRACNLQPALSAGPDAAHVAVSKAAAAGCSILGQRATLDDGSEVDVGVDVDL